MAILEGLNARGEKTIPEQKKKAQEDKEKQLEQEAGFWGKQIIAWNSLLKALKADQIENEEAKESGTPNPAPSKNIKLWWKKYWGNAIVWGILILLLMKLAKQPPARNHHRKGSRYNP